MMYKYVIFLYIFSIYFGHLDTGITPFFISKTGTILLIFAAVTSNFYSFFNFSRVSKLLLFLLFLTSIRNYYFPNSEISLINLEFLLIILSLESFIVLIYSSKINFQIITNYTIFFSTLAALFIVLRLGDSSWEGRHTIDGQNQNLLAVNISIGVIFNSIKLIKSKNKLLYIISFIVMLTALTMTGSRSGFIIFIIGVFGILYRYNLFIQLEKKIFFNIVIILFTLLIGFFIIEGDNVLVSRFVNNSSTDLSGRDEYWKIMPLWVEDNWLFGIGKSGLYSKSISTFGASRSPHNLYIKTYVQTGIVGLLVVILILKELFKLKKITKNNILSLSSLLVFFCLSLVAHPLLTKSMWLLFLPSLVFTKKNNEL